MKQKPREREASGIMNAFEHEVVESPPRYRSPAAKEDEIHQTMLLPSLRVHGRTMGLYLEHVG